MIKPYLLLFLVGILKDILVGRLLGQTALLLLVICGLGLWIKTRFEFKLQWLVLVLILCAMFF